LHRIGWRIFAFVGPGLVISRAQYRQTLSLRNAGLAEDSRRKNRNFGASMITPRGLPNRHQNAVEIDDRNTISICELFSNREAARRSKKNEAARSGGPAAHAIVS
jgi:hypothetical protein